MNAETGEIVAAGLTTNDVDDAAQVGPLLGQMAGPVASITGVGAYDQDSRRLKERAGVASGVPPPPARRPQGCAFMPPTMGGGSTRRLGLPSRWSVRHGWLREDRRHRWRWIVARPPGLRP
jgi:hypothetical protein